MSAVAAENIRLLGQLVKIYFSFDGTNFQADCLMSIYHKREAQMPTQLDFAYAAGLVDGEGCFQLYRKVNGNLVRYLPTFSIGMTDLHALTWLESTFGGNVYKVAKVKGKSEEAFQWALNKRSILQPFVEGIYPFIKTKILCAHIILEFYREFPYHLRYNSDDYEKALRYRELMSAANAKGPGSASRKAELIATITGRPALYAKPSAPLIEIDSLLSELENA